MGMNSPGEDLVYAIEHGALTKAVDEIAALVKSDELEASATVRSKRFGVVDITVKTRPE